MRASVPFLLLLWQRSYARYELGMIIQNCMCNIGFVIGAVIQCSHKLTLNVPIRLSVALKALITPLL